MVEESIGAVKLNEKNGRDCIYVEGNVSFTFTATVIQSQGCAVFFQWNFNDSSPDVTTTSESIIEIMSSAMQYQVKDGKVLLNL